MDKKTAIIIISHNSKKITDDLCENIIRNTKSPYDIIVVETGSKIDQISSYTSIWCNEGIRMTRGFNLGIQYALQKENWWKYSDKPFEYDWFWCMVNDSKLDEIDTLTPMINVMKENTDCGEIHPYIKNSPSKCLHQKDNGKTRKESFCEIVCPLFSRKAISLNLFDNRFFFGWGIDYTIPFYLHLNNLRLYISNEVSVIHDAGTTTKSGSDEKFKTMVEQFDVSRQNMMDGLIEKYGKDWAKRFYSAIPEDVSKDAFVEWVVHIGANVKMEDLIC